MARWSPIVYRDFYDVPRAIVAVDERGTYFLNCPFDETRDEYPDHYDVYLMPPLGADDLKGSWASLEERCIRRLGSLPVARVSFDGTRRQAIDLDVLDIINS
jgi:hypothetical protein